MIKKFESYGDLGYLLTTTKEVMYDLPDGYTCNAYVEDGRLDVEIMSDEPPHELKDKPQFFEGKTAQVTERLAYVIRLCEMDGLKPYVALVLHIPNTHLYLPLTGQLLEHVFGFLPEDDAEERLEKIMSGKDRLISVRIAFSKPSRISTSQELPNGPEASQVQRVLNILKTLYTIDEKQMTWPFGPPGSGEESSYTMTFLRLHAGENSINLHYTSMGDARKRLFNDIEELDVENLGASTASINKAIKLYLEPHYKKIK